MKKTIYQKPLVETCVINVEKGFSLSQSVLGSQNPGCPGGVVIEQFENGPEVLMQK